MSWKITPADINCVLNRTLISGQTNRKISRSSPSEYLPKLVPANRMHMIMRSHFIDDLALKAMQANNSENFLNAREIELLTEMEAKITG